MTLTELLKQVDKIAADMIENVDLRAHRVRALTDLRKHVNEALHNGLTVHVVHEHEDSEGSSIVAAYIDAHVAQAEVDLRSLGVKAECDIVDIAETKLVLK